MSKKTWLWLIALIVIGSVGWEVWRGVRPRGLGEGLASGNGRIEATEVDVATKLAGRIAEILVDEGDFVSAGQVVARMDSQVLAAELAQAKAYVRQANHAVNAAKAVVTQRESEKATAEAVVAQREFQLASEEREFRRIEALFANSNAAQKELDDARTAMQTAQAALTAARAQVASSQAGIEAAKAQVVESESAVEAAIATTTRLEAELEDSQLKSPRTGRVQYRVAQVGEVLSGGGKVLNLVDLSDVYMTFFLPTAQAGRVALGQEARLIIDAAPQYVIPASVSYVASVAQFTPKTVETASEREKLMFRVKARIDRDLLEKHLAQVKTGVPGMAYLKLEPSAEWPDKLRINVPQ